MSRIDELVERLCPDGVEYRALGEVACYAKERIAAYALEEGSYVGVNELLQEYRGRSYEIHLPSEDKCIAYKPKDILLGNIRPYLKKMWLADCSGGTNGDVLVIRVNDETQVSPDFLWQVLAGGVLPSTTSQTPRVPRCPEETRRRYSNFASPCRRWRCRRRSCGC